jgi:RNA polymerase sigma factor (sigma-70 family)
MSRQHLRRKRRIRQAQPVVTAEESHPSLNTCWTLLLQAHSEDDTCREKAWEWFTTRYRRPIVAFFRAYGVSAAEAEVLAQDFIGDLFRKQSLDRVKREGGRFRSWLYTCLQNLATDCFRKRGHLVELPTEYEPDAPPASRPDVVFERAWSANLLGQAIGALETAYSGNEKRRALFHCFLAHATGDPGPETFAAIAQKLEMHHGSVRNAHAVFKEQLRNQLRAAVAATVAFEDEIDGEIAHLRRVLAQ